MASSISQRLADLEDRLAKAETEVKRLKGTVTAHGVALRDKDK